MALTGTDRGTGTHKTSASSFTLNPGSNFTAGALAVLCIAADNSSTGGSTNNISSVTDSLGNLAGQAFFSLGADGNIENGNTTIPAYGTAGFTLSAAGTVIGALLASGSASIVLDAQGDAYLAINAAGGSTLSVGAAGSLRGLGAVLGLGEVALGAQASLTGIGSLAGTSGVSVLPNGNIFSPLWTSGQTGVSIGIQGGISGAAWASGGVSFDLLAQGLLSGIGAISGAAWFALRARHFDLSHHQRVYVTAVVESLYVQPVANQIIAVAAHNNLSVLDALQVITAKHEARQLVAQNERKVSAERSVSLVRTYSPKHEKAVTNPPAYATDRTFGVFAVTGNQAIYTSTAENGVVAFYSTNSLLIQHQPRRDALEHS